MTPVTDEDCLDAAGTGRRPLLKFLAGSAALGGIGAAARIGLYRAPDEDAQSPAGGLELVTHAGSDVASLRLPLGDTALPRVGVGQWESRRFPTSTHSMVAFTWPADQDPPRALIRSRRAGAWGDWSRIPVLLDVPSAAEEETAVAGTDLMWIGRADGVQVRVEGRRPEGLALVLLYPQRRPGDLLVEGLTARTVQRPDSETAQLVPQPRLITREEWGANESLRGERPTYIHTIKQVHVHHTVNSNTYARDDVPALIRGMYAYHTQSLGWSDIAYNFLVDRFGRAFVGRAGGPAKLVRGAHTLGFNAESTGVSAIGNYDTARPGEAMINAMAGIAAWKLDPFDRKPRGEIRVESEGSDRFASGRVVELPVIDGHRDTNQTACPGQHLYDALPQVRRRAARILAATQQTTVVIEQPATIVGAARLGESLRVDLGTYRPGGATASFRWMRGDRPIRGAREQTHRVRPWDVGRPLTCHVTLSATGLDPVTQIPDRVGPVTTESSIIVTTSVRRRTVRVHITLAAPPDVHPVPTGSVSVRVGDRVKTVAVQKGKAVARFGGHRRLGAGRYPVRVRYSGDDAFTPGVDETTVRVT